MMKKSVAIQTPNGKQIRIDEDQNLIEISDQHQNRIVLDQNGIVIESGKDRTLKALQNMKIEAFKYRRKPDLHRNSVARTSADQSCQQYGNRRHLCSLL